MGFSCEYSLFDYISNHVLKQMEANKKEDKGLFGEQINLSPLRKLLL